MKPIKVKTKTGIKYKADPTYRGKRLGARTFDTSLEAQQYHLEKRSHARAFETGGTIKGKSFGDALSRYQETATPSKKGARWEHIRINKILRDQICDVLLVELTYEHIEDWIERCRDNDLKDASIRRELNILSAVLKRAKKWRWLKDSPMDLVDKPSGGEHRRRRVSQDEIETMSAELNLHQLPVKTKTQETGICWLFAIETGMRCSEITQMRESDFKGHTVHISDSKNGKSRTVPLSERAEELLDMLPRNNTGRVFSVNSGVVSSLFYKARKKAGIDDMVFHDSRHECCSRFVERRLFDPIELTRIMGWSDPKMAMVYYEADADDLAARLRA